MICYRFQKGKNNVFIEDLDTSANVYLAALSGG